VADICDNAQAVELLLRAEALDRARLRPAGPGPVYIDGVACCRTCQEPICSARLKAVPGCCQCRECQEEAEGS